MALMIQMDMYGFIPIKTAATVETQVVALLAVPQVVALQLHQHRSQRQHRSRHQHRARQPQKQKQRSQQTAVEIL